MKLTALAVFLLISWGGTVHTTKNPPQLLTRAVGCLAIKNFLPQSQGRRRSFGYFLDDKSYVGEKVIYVVDYSKPGRSDGWVFVVFLTERDGRQHFNIQNNARFVLFKHDFEGVSFVDPPLGGVWTQQHIALAIRRIETETKFILDDKNLQAATQSITCESYTENLRSHY